MTLHTAIERSDEDDGKYSTNADITFENLLKQSARQADAQPTPDDQPQEPTLDVTDTGTPTNAGDTHGANHAVASDPNSVSAVREAMADVVATAHTESGADKTYLVTETDAIGEGTTYSFNKAQIEGETYYYLLQQTRQPGSPLLETWAVLDVGTDWTYRIPDLDPAVLQEAIRAARTQDWRAGKAETVAYLTDDQLATIQQEYRSLLETRLTSLAETATAHDQSRISVYGEYVVADVSDVVLEARLRDELTERQLPVVTETLLSAVLPNLDIHNWQQQVVTPDGEACPLIAELICEI